MTTNCGQVITKKTIEPLDSISSLGFVMPFQPSMWDDRCIQSALDYTTHIIETKLKISYSGECANTMLGRLKQLFDRLNFNTHRKSIAVIISADSEKVIYLNFPVRLFVSTCNFVSILDLVASIKQETSFYLFFICEENAALFEYYGKQLNKVYEQKPDGLCGHLVDANIRASWVISYMNSSYHKPVFIVGNREQMNSFQRAVPFPEIIFQIMIPHVQYGAETIQAVIKEIAGQWSYWLSKFHIGRICLAKKNSTFVSHYKEVLKSLCNSADGLLLMDRSLKRQLQNPASCDTYFHESKKFINQIERFVERGNCLEIQENDLLREWGGIVLLPDAMSRHRNELSFGGYRIYGGAGSLF
jgi:hypothetical protein